MSLNNMERERNLLHMNRIGIDGKIIIIKTNSWGFLIIMNTHFNNENWEEG